MLHFHECACDTVRLHELCCVMLLYLLGTLHVYAMLLADACCCKRDCHSSHPGQQ